VVTTGRAAQIAVLILLTVAVISVTACSKKPATPAEAALTFVEALTRGDVNAASSLMSAAAAAQVSSGYITALSAGLRDCSKSKMETMGGQGRKCSVHSSLWEPVDVLPSSTNQRAERLLS
jgi:hypothetical protein